MNKKTALHVFRFWRMVSVSLFFVQILGFFLNPSFVQAAASPQNIISYQGRLLNSNRAPISDASASILFELYTASSGGSCVWSNSSASCASATARTVTLTDGLFSEPLGDTAVSPAYAAISDAIFGDNTTLYLQVTVNGEALSPRKQIVSAPYAINAQLLDGLDADADGTTAAAIVAYNSSGNLVVTGNPGGSGVSQGALYINSASADTSTNDTLFGVALEGTSRFRVDTEGDVTVLGDLAANDFTCMDCLGFSEIADSLSLDAETMLTNGSNHLIFNLDSTGDFVIRDSGTDFVRFESHSVLSIQPANVTETGVNINFTTSTTGSGVGIIREDTATDYDGSLLLVKQEETSATSDATALDVVQNGGGNSSAVYITQDQVADAVATPTAQALVIDVNEAASNDEVILIRSDADGGGVDTEFRFENDGDFFGDGATYNSGADYAEFFPTADSTLGDYEVICFDPHSENGVQRCAVGDTHIVGVISTNPGFVGNNLVGAEGNLEGDPNYALVGLVGQIETYVSSDAGAIAIGDPLTTSSVRAGYAAKASGGSYIIGRALEPLAHGTGTVKVLVQPMWYGGDMLTMDGEAVEFAGDITLAGAQATAINPTIDSAGLSFVGSSWNGVSADNVSLSLHHDILSGASSRLSLVNDAGVDVMTFGSTGDLAISGNFYPSDRGVLQYGAYVYYDSTGSGYMKTNASGWSSRSSGFSEMFASEDALTPGDVVEFSSDASIGLSSGEPYSARIAGVVSSDVGFLAGNSSGSYAVVLSGRVSTKVSIENGSIAPGDALTTSSRPGFVMKATEDGHILGYALESWSSGEGDILVLVRPHYVAYGETAVSSSSLALHSQDVETLNVSGALNVNGGDIINVGTLSGIGTWEIQEDGDIVTHGQLTQVVRSLQNTQVSTYATTSTETLVQLSGTTTLHGGMARISFEDINPEYNDVISPDLAYRVLVTPNGITGQLYVTDRSNAGFIIRDADGGNGVSVDWLVLAYRYDLVPEVIGNDEIVSDAPLEEIAAKEAPEEVVSEEEDVLDEEESDIEHVEEHVEVEEVVEDGAISGEDELDSLDDTIAPSEELEDTDSTPVAQEEAVNPIETAVLIDGGL